MRTIEEMSKIIGIDDTITGMELRRAYVYYQEQEQISEESFLPDEIKLEFTLAKRAVLEALVEKYQLN